MSRKGKGGQANAKRPRQNGKRSNPFNATANGDRPSSSSSSQSTDVELTSSAPMAAALDASDYARRINKQLEKDGVRPPRWPAEPGNPKSKAEMASFREQYKKYCDRARTSLIKAALIDDPDKPKRLQDAIEFKGICEEMCPEFEKITRITEHDVVLAERDAASGWALTHKMVKKLARSAAGQEAPLPMEVRSTASLRRTTNYLVDDLLRSEDRLPAMHGFLWDRTRAIRRDFIFFSTLSPEELSDQVYCLEHITRFHVTSLHLMGRDGFAPEDFSEQQEVEQLSKALLSLIYAYNDCHDRNIPCQNEAEFRACYVLLNAHQPNILEQVQREWDARFWKTSDEVRTAVSLREALMSTKSLHGPMTPGPALAAASSYQTYFKILESPKVSYMMACFAEIHFGQLRRSILEALMKALRRPKGYAKDITPALVNSFLRFDNEDQAINFVEQHGLSFIVEGNDTYLDVRQNLSRPRIKHAFSKHIVEKKKGKHSLPDVIHSTVYQDASHPADDSDDDSDSLFVSSREAEKSNPFARGPISSSNGLATPSLVSSTISASPSQAGKPMVNPFAPPTSQATLFNSEVTDQGPLTSTSRPTESTTAPSSVFQNPFAAAASKSSAAIFAKANTPRTPSPGQPSSGSTVPNPFATALANLAQPAAQKPTETPASGSAPEIKVIPPTPRFTSQQQEPRIASSPFQGFQPATKPPTNPVQAAPGSILQATPSPPVPEVAKAEQPLASSQGMSGPARFSFPPSQPPTQTPPKIPQPTTVPTPQPSFKSTPPASTSSTLSQPLSQSHQTQKPTQNESVSFPKQSWSLSTPPAAAKSFNAPPPPPKKRDFLGDFAAWFVKGDEGLLQEFEIFVVEQIVREAFEQHEQEQEEEKVKVEEERNLAAAKRFREGSLSARYFRRWRENARKLQLRRIRRLEREKAREYYEAKRVAAQEKAAQSQRALLASTRRRESNASHETWDTVDEFRHLLKQPRRDDVRKAEDALLASGVLSGVADEHNVIAHIVRGVETPPETGTNAAPKVSLAKKIKNSLSQSIASIKPGGVKTQALREEFGSSTLRRSTPVRSHSRSPSEQPQRPSKVSDRWRLKAMGLVTMPNGTALPESLAYPMLNEGKRYRGWGSYGVPPADPSLRRVSASEYDFGSSKHDLSGRLVASQGSSGSPPLVNGGSPVNKRKRGREEEEADREGGDRSKRVASNESDTDRIIRELREWRKEMEGEREWLKEQNDHMAMELSSRGTTPWDRKSTHA